MFDIFYSGPKPNQFAHEQHASSIEHAQHLSRTEYFWWITYLADYSSFDFLYVPPPWQAEYTHTWPSQHHAYSGTCLVPKQGKIEYHFHNQVILNRVNSEHYCVLHQSDFDFSWSPHPHDPPYIYVFGNQWHPANVMPTVEYCVPGATERKYMTAPKATLPKNPNQLWYDVVSDCDWDYSWQPDPGDPSYIYVFGNQWWPAEKMPTIEYRVPGATERKYVNYPRVTLTASMQNWKVPDNLDVADFDFSWVPDPGAPPYIYQFATQHQKTGGPVYTVPGATEVKYLSELRARTTRVATAIYEIDHLDGAAGQIANTTRRVRYFDNYRDTLIRLAKSIGDAHEYVWVCSSICDYSTFDFSWHPEAWQAMMLHVFASNEQKFGDTFFMHVPSFAELAEKKALLDWYDVNYVPDVSVPRRSMPVILHTDDSHVEQVKNTDWTGPLAVFSIGPVPVAMPTVSLWRQETKTIVPLSAGASAVIVPKTAKSTIKTQLYDYSYIDKSQKTSNDVSMDVIFISNGESMAEQNWQHLIKSCPWAKRSNGINGRERAYKSAAELSSTPWFYAVFAKTEVYPTFKFDYQPDRMQQPKHYIFHSRNPVNGLEYGAMNVNLYNRQLVLDTNPGIDFTLSAAHEVVPVCISTTRFNTDPWVTWRSAFREVLKLKLEVNQGADVEIQYRLNTWLSVAAGNNAEWCLAGGQDAINYYTSVNGDYKKLSLSFDWQWLQDYYYSLYQTRPWLEL